LHTDRARRDWLGPVSASALYFFIAIVFTWPLIKGISRDIPWDLGDSLLNCWILSWDADHLIRLLSGDLHAMRGFWTANIFYPEPLTLAYSEHLFAQAVQMLPLYVLTHNVILCYNVLFLSTFVLSGLGMYLFVREVTANTRAAFIAGLLYAFAPLRVPQFAHLQVLSSQWMPFALYGLRRFFDTRRIPPLAGGGAALVAQNLSCGYFLLFFAPCVVAYVLFEIVSRRLWGDVRVWLGLGVTAVSVTFLTLPFLLPYVELRQLGFPPRSYYEIVTYSADVYSYWTAPSESRLWGRAIRSFPKPEGDLFPSLTLLGLAGVAFLAATRTAWARSHGSTAATPVLSKFVYVVALGCVVYSSILILILTGNGFADIGSMPISVKSLARNCQILIAAFVVLMATSPKARSFTRLWTGSAAGFALLLAAATFLLSLGPEIRSLGRTLHGTPPYALLYWHVAGFDGLRVPARYGMLNAMFLSIAAGSGAAEIQRITRHGGVILAALGVFAIAESIAAPISINGTGPAVDLALPPSRVMTGDQVPPVYRYLRTLPPQTVIGEFPFGEWNYELRYVFYSQEHWHPLINGYSGMFPLSYDIRSAFLRRPEEDPQRSWDSLQTSGATHAVVHEDYYLNGEGRVVSQWLLNHGARLVSEFGGDKVYALK